MEIVAVVPAWNARGRLATVLDAIEGQVAHTIVIDNGSDDGTAAWLAESRRKIETICNDHNLGYPAAVNQGLHRALDLGAEAAVLVNDDARFEEGAVATLSHTLGSDGSAAAANAKMLYEAWPTILNGTGGQWWPSRAWAALRGEGEVDRGQYDHLAVADYPSGAASLLRLATVAEVGLFDEEYFLYYEDVDWGLRCRREGWCIRYVPSAVVYHGGSSSTSGDAARRRYYNVRNRLRFAARHAPPWGQAYAWLSTAALMAKQPARWLLPSRRRDAQAVLFAVADHLRGRYGQSPTFG